MRASGEADQDYLFDLSPIPTWEEDFSAVRGHLAEVGLLGQPEPAVREALARRPEVVARCIASVRIVRLNRACLVLYRAASDAELVTGLARLVCDESHAALVEQIVAVACERTELALDTAIRTLDGQRRDVHLRWRVARGFETTLARVIVCTEDVSERKRAEAEQRARVEEFAALAEIGNLLAGSASAGDLASAAVAAVRRATQVDAVFFFRVDAEGGLGFVAGAPAGGVGDHAAATLRCGECLCGMALSSRGPIFSRHLATDPNCTRDECEDAGYCSFAAVPIVVDARVEAVIGLATREERDLASRAHFFGALAGTVALSLRNAMLVARLRHHGEALEQQIAARQRAEEQLRGEAALSESIILSLPAVFYLFNEDGRFLRWNTAFEQATGRSADELALLHPVDLFAEPDKALVAARIAEVFTRGDSSVEAFLVAKDGSRRPFYFTGQRVEVGGARCLIGVGLDLTSRYQAERSLRDLSLAVEASGDVVFVTDRSGTIESVNSRFQSLYGLDRSEVVGRATPRVLKSGHQDAATYQQFWRVITGGELFRGEVVNRAKDGREVVVDETVSPFLDESGAVRGYLAIQRDITERKRMEQDRERLRDQLSESQKLEALGRLAGGVAHDFNNILTIIRCYTGLLAKDLSETDPRRSDVDAIMDASERAVALTGQLLAFSRRQVLEPHVVALNPIVSGIEAMLRRLLNENIEIAVRLGAEHDSVLADAGKLGQVLLNLAVNARDAMPRGGRLEIATANVRFDAAAAAARGLGPGDFVRLSVRDDGEGMDAETLAHIFEPFFTTKERGRGTGLGLATVYGIVAQSGGAIHASGEPGQGATFEVLLPLASGTRSETALKRGVVAEGGSGTILVVEDEDAVRGVIDRILRHAGYQVLVAADGVEALTLIAEPRREPLCLVLTDVIMPRMGGAELAARLAAGHPDLAVILMTGYTEDALERAAVASAGDRLISKPFTADELIKKIQQVLGKS